MKKLVVIQFVKRFAKVGAIFVLFMCAFSFFVPYDDYVYDSAGIFSSETKERINNTSKRFRKKFGTGIMVATIKSWDEKDSRGLDRFGSLEKWTVDCGSSKHSNFLNIFISEKERGV
ncbi:hypothetical protein FACS1894198_6480 [Clostridia bacterium]|nr:hypothetical protein FACS1894198_6480 [Clostridia bacterium]